jgi:hypothetical protein
MTKKTVVSSLLVGGALLALYRGANRNTIAYGRHGRGGAGGRDAADDAARRYLMYVVMPVWAVSGFLDWLWHRQTKIETTSGVKESIMHLVMMAEAGAPILTGMFLEINAGALALMGAGWLLHELTVAWDVKYTSSRRPIFPREQHTHSYMQTIPFGIVVTLGCLYPEQCKSLFGVGKEKPDFKLRLRKPPVPLRDFAAIVAGMGIVSGLPHLEELWRCYSAKRKGLEGLDIPKCAQDLYTS